MQRVLFWSVFLKTHNTPKEVWFAGWKEFACFCFRKSSCTMAHLPVLLLGSRETISMLKFSPRDFAMWAKSSCPFQFNIPIREANGCPKKITTFLRLGSPQPFQILHVAKRFCPGVDVCWCHFLPQRDWKWDQMSTSATSSPQTLRSWQCLKFCLPTGHHHAGCWWTIWANGSPFSFSYTESWLGIWMDLTWVRSVSRFQLGRCVVRQFLWWTWK